MSLLLALVPLAKNTSRTAPSPSRLVSACSTITRSDVEQALGRVVNHGREELQDARSTCDFTGRQGLVTITMQRSAVRLDLSRELTSLKAAMPGAHIRESRVINGIAYFVDIPGAGAQLHVVRDERDYVMVSVLGFGSASEVHDAAKKLALKALARL